MGFWANAVTVDVGEIDVLALISDIIKSHVYHAGCAYVSVSGQAVIAKGAI